MKTLLLSAVCGLVSTLAANGVGVPWVVTRLDRQSSAVSTGAGDSLSPAISRDGRVVVFSSHAGNLIAGDRNGAVLDVFTYDVLAERIEKVSQGNAGNVVSGRSYGASLSADGRFVAFLSEANLVGNGSNSGVATVYVRDRELQRTILVSKDRTGTGPANGPCQGLQLSADGRRVCFSSRATNLTPDATDGRLSLFVHDLDVGETRCLTQPEVKEIGDRADVLEYLMSEDGSSVVFTYDGGSLTRVEPEVPTTAYFWKFGEVLATKVGAPGIPLAGFQPVGAYNLAIDASGGAIVFQTARVPVTAVASFEGGVLLHETRGRTIRRLSEGLSSVNPWNASDASAPVVSGDGGVVVFLASMAVGRGEDTPQRMIHVWTPEVGVRLLTRSNEGIGAGEGIAAENLVLSRDGRRLAFLSRTVLAGVVDRTNEWQLYMMDLGSRTIQLVNRGLGGRAAGGVEGSDPVLSGDGRLLAFTSRASNLVEGDANAAADVFVFDWETDQLKLASRRASELPGQTSVRGSRVAVRGMSNEGRVVLLETLSQELVSNQTWGLSQFVVQELSTGQRTMVGQSTNQGAAAQAGVQQALLSGNGRFVAFVSNSRDIWPGETNGLEHVYLQDLATGTLQWISKRRERGSELRRVALEIHSISTAGRFVILRTSDMTQFLEVSLKAGLLVYDRLTEKLTAHPAIATSHIPPVLAPESGVFGIVQMGHAIGTLEVQIIPLAGGAIDRFPAPTNGSTGFHLSANGKRCVFSIDGGVQTEIFYRDVGMAAVAPLALPVELQRPLTIRSLSYDGRFALMESGGTVYRFELSTGKAESVLNEPGGTLLPDGVAEQSVMDLVGDRVLFRRRITRPSLNPVGDQGMIHAWNLSRPSVAVLRPGAAEALPGEYSTRPLISADGRLAVFTSWVDDLPSGDFNGLGDVFAVELEEGSTGRVDLDADGLEDRWEIQWFGELGKNGLQDTDGDGLSDAGEFLAGTVPVDDGSTLRLTIEPDGEGVVSIRWKTAPGREYRMRERLGLDGNWAEWPEVIRGDGGIARVPGRTNSIGPRFFQLSVATGRP